MGSRAAMRPSQRVRAACAGQHLVLCLCRRFQSHLQYAVTKQWEHDHASSPLLPDHHCLHLSNDSTSSLLVRVSPSPSGGSNTHPAVASGADHDCPELSCSGLLPPEGELHEIRSPDSPISPCGPGTGCTVDSQTICADCNKLQKKKIIKIRKTRTTSPGPPDRPE